MDGERTLLCLKEFRFPVQGDVRTFKQGDRIPESVFRGEATVQRQRQMVSARFVKEDAPIVVAAPRKRGRPRKAG